MRKAFVLGNVRCFLHKDVFETNHKWSLNLETTDSRDFLTFSLNQKRQIKLKKGHHKTNINEMCSYYLIIDEKSYSISYDRKIEIKIKLTN